MKRKHDQSEFGFKGIQLSDSDESLTTPAQKKMKRDSETSVSSTVSSDSASDRDADSQGQEGTTSST